MLTKAVKDYNAVPVTKPQTLSQELLPTDCPSRTQGTGKTFRPPQPCQATSSRPNVLKPTARININGCFSSNGGSSVTSQKRSTSSISGFAHSSDAHHGVTIEAGVVDLTQSPRKGGRVGKLHQAVFFDENDFENDEDLNLDVEDPQTKGNLSHSMPVIGLPQREDSDLQLTYEQPSSSAPLPWSSSPTQHKATPPNANLLQRKPSSTGRSAIPSKRLSPEDGRHLPNKRRTLPWHENEAEQHNEEPPKAPADIQKIIDQKKSRDQVKGISSSTPLPRDKKSLDYPWNKTASAVKEEQRKLRKNNKKLAKPTTSVQKGEKIDPARVFLSDEQRRVLSLVTDATKSVFFTGSAGTGKSLLLREIIRALRVKHAREPDRVAVTASTGLAACNIGGVTLHSFGGIGLGKEPAHELVKKIKRNQKARNRWIRTKVLIIDEISMVDGDLFDKLETIARNIRNNGRPFGGIQLVITGDFFQLPPVPDAGKASTFAFDAGSWMTSIDHTIGLTQIFRQKDPEFASMLNEMRVGKLSQKSITAFKTLNRPLGFHDDIEATELFPTRSEVDGANNARMRNLHGNGIEFKCVDGGIINDIAARDKMLSNCMAPPSITLKKGSQVMLIKNIDDTLVNGSLGRVVGFMDEKTFDLYHENEDEFQTAETIGPNGEDMTKSKLKLKALINRDFSTHTSHKWPLVRFTIADGTSRDLLCQHETWKFELPNGEVQAYRSQVPLILAWALSIHKAQGQTMARVKVDLGRIFENGQAYVALSRATSQEGLQVMKFDSRKVMAHPKVRKFYDSLYSIDKASGTMLVKSEGNTAAHTSDIFQPQPAACMTYSDDEEAEQAYAQMHVTLKSPPDAQVRGVVAHIEQQKLILHDVTWLASGNRSASFPVDGTNISDLEVVPVPLGRGGLDNSAGGRRGVNSYVRNHATVPERSENNPPIYGSIIPATQAPKRPTPVSSAQHHVDPAILSFARQSSKNPNDDDRESQLPQASRKPQEMHAVGAIAGSSQVTPTLRPTPTIPMTTKPKLSTTQPVSKESLNSATMATLSAPFDTLSIDTNPGVQHVLNTATINSNGGGQKTSRTDLYPEAVQISPTKPRGKKARRGARGRLGRAVPDKDSEPGKLNTSLTVNQSQQSHGPSGWRQSPILKEAPSDSALKRTPEGERSSHLKVPPTKKTSRRGKLSRINEDPNGWATEDATDIQELGEFDFAANLSKFDKNQVFNQIRNDDTTADEDRLVSHNRLPRPGTAGGKNLHFTENVLDSPRTNGNPAWNSEAGESELELELSEARISSERSSKRNNSRATTRRPPSRKGSALSAPGVDEPTKSRRGSLGKVRYPAFEHSGSPKPRVGFPNSSNEAPPSASILGSSLWVFPSNIPCPYLSPLQMLELEQYAISEFGITEEILNENAGRGIAETVLSIKKRKVPDVTGHIQPALPSITILAGNNTTGARAIAAGRHLQNHGSQVYLHVLGMDRSEDLREVVENQMSSYRRGGGKMVRQNELLEKMRRARDRPHMIIDALLGMHTDFEDLRTEDQEAFLELVQSTNRHEVPVMAIDVPSGLDASTGMITAMEGGNAVFRPSYVLSLGAPKTGLLSLLSSFISTVTVELYLADIGISNLAWKRFGNRRKKGIPFGRDWIATLKYRGDTSS